jgi:DNA-binding response OmpR family regulator
VVRVLILEDESLIGMMLADWLHDLGCEPIGPAGTERQALDLIESMAVDAAILDVSLGQATSYAVAASLRRRHIPFVFASGHGAGGITAEFRDAPMLNKPFDFEDVRAAIAGLLPATEAGTEV